MNGNNIIVHNINIDLIKSPELLDALTKLLCDYKVAGVGTYGEGINGIYDYSVTIMRFQKESDLFSLSVELEIRPMKITGCAMLHNSSGEDLIRDAFPWADGPAEPAEEEPYPFD